MRKKNLRRLTSTLLAAFAFAAASAPSRSFAMDADHRGVYTGNQDHTGQVQSFYTPQAAAAANWSGPSQVYISPNGGRQTSTSSGSLVTTGNWIYKAYYVDGQHTNGFVIVYYNAMCTGGSCAGKPAPAIGSCWIDGYGVYDSNCSPGYPRVL